VVPGGPAADAGLKGGRTETTQGISAGGDLVVNVDGKNVANSNDVATAIADKKPGDSVTIEYYRGNSKKSAKVKLGKRPNQLQQQSTPDPSTPQPLP
jgi:2-alkenal reductase